MSTAGTLERMILSPDASIDEVAAWLDALAPNVRIEETRALGPAPQAALWRLTAGRTFTLDDLVPPDYGPLEPVRHFGRNTLPAFRLFEKRFCRPSVPTPEPCLWGYNEGPTRALVGPGYFVTRLTPNDPRGGSVVDYWQVPTERPTQWPEVRDNTDGLQRFVYARMHDFLRKVSAHVSIGRAWREHKATDNYFVLCREG